MSEVNTLLVGRNRLFLEGLKSLLRGSSFNVCSELTSVSALGEVTDAADLELILIELRGEVSRLVDDLRQLQNELPNTPIVVLTDERDPRTLAACLNAGADAFLLKDISLEALIHSLKLAMMGQKVMPTDLATALINGAVGVAPVGDKRIEEYGLSDREQEILRCLVYGDANKVIANRLDITEATVKVHMKSLLRKIKAGNRTQAAIWALNHGMAPGLPFGGGAEPMFPAASGAPALSQLTG
ncbi:LuxR C-terminal-related transcriptional regulator [Pelagibius sp.]|uniref:LuxR C-terminal-related transcriptional regulator n=1 Tax=Pelagibius sp. TaxID=1931238 RepID=UPI003BB1483A